MIKYYKPICTTEYTYSLDKLRLSIDMKNNFCSFVSYMQSACDYDLRLDIKYVQSFGNFKYRHLWTVSIPADDISFAIGMTLNGKKDEETKGWIEFNPNKCMNSSAFCEFLARFFSYAIYREIVRYDLAIDMPISRGLCKLIKTNKRQYKLISADSITEELGKHNTEGFSKLYDKSAESDLDYPLTRLEITLERDTDPRKVFPKVMISDYQRSFNFDLKVLSPKDSVFVGLLINCSFEDFSFYYNQLDSRTKNKFDPYIFGSSEFELNYSSARDVFELARTFEQRRII